MSSRGRAVAIIAIALLTVLAGAVPGVVGSASAAPPGMVGVPDANIGTDLPPSTPMGDAAALIEEEGVYASSNAATLEVIVTNPGRAKEKYAGGSLHGGGPIAIVLADDEHHEGREVAIPVEGLELALGYYPEAAYGTHEDGSEWLEPIEYVDGYAVVEIPHFSSNTVTFSGEVSLQGSPATDGAAYSYETKDLDAVGNFSVVLTGAITSEWDNESATRAALDHTMPVTVGGNAEPIGPGGGDPRVSIESRSEQLAQTDYVDYGSNTIGAFGDQSGYLTKSEAVIQSPPSTIDGIELDLTAGSGTVTVDVYLNEDGAVDDVYGEGTLVADDLTLTSDGTGRYLIPFDSPYNVADGAGDLTIEFVTVSGDNKWSYRQDDVNTGSTLVGYKYDSSTSPTHDPEPIGAWLNPTPSSVTVEADTGANQTITLSGSSGAGTLDLQTSTTAVNVTSTEVGIVNVSIELQERTETADPAVAVNGNWANYTGTLSEGTTTSLSVNESWVVEGTNRVNVSVGDGTLSGDAPTPAVGLDYSHEAVSDTVVSYEGETWSERYNVSRTWADDRASASLTIPFASSRVIAIRSIETRTNGGTWTSVSSADYSLDGTEMTVELGSVTGGDTTDVRATASKVTVHNGSIDVVTPTTVGDPLVTEFALTSWAADSYIGVGGTDVGGEIHYTTEETWSDPSGYSIFTSGGAQEVHLPNAASGDVATIRTVPVVVEPASGDARVSIPNDDPSLTEPAFKVEPGATEGDEVAFTFVDAADGETYSLYSLTNKIVRDQGTAQSPLTLTDDDSSEVLRFLLEGDGSSTGTGETGVIAPIQAGGTILDSIPIVLVAGVLALVGTLYATRRWITEDRSVTLAVTALAVLVIIVVTGEAFNPGVLLGPIAEQFATIVPAVGLTAAGLGAYWVYTRFIRGRDTTIEVVGRER